MKNQYKTLIIPIDILLFFLKAISLKIKISLFAKYFYIARGRGMNFELWVSIVNSQKDFGQYRDFLRGFPSKSVGVMTPTTPTVPRPLKIYNMCITFFLNKTLRLSDDGV